MKNNLLSIIVPVYNEDGCNPNGSKTRNLKEILTPSLNINYYK